MTSEKVAMVARLCHELNREYCAELGDLSQARWNQAPEWQRESAVKGVEFHLEKLRAGEEVKASASHESWLKEKTEQGWKYGGVKDAGKKEHPCCVPFEELPREQQAKDYLFAGVVRAMFEAGVLE